MSSVKEMKEMNYEEESDYWGSGEDYSSRSHSLPDGTGNDIVHGPWTVLAGRVNYSLGGMLREVSSF